MDHQWLRPLLWLVSSFFNHSWKHPRAPSSVSPCTRGSVMFQVTMFMKLVLNANCGVSLLDFLSRAGGEFGDCGTETVSRSDWIDGDKHGIANILRRLRSSFSSYIKHFTTFDLSRQKMCLSSQGLLRPRTLYNQLVIGRAVRWVKSRSWDLTADLLWKRIRKYDEMTCFIQ